MKTILKSNDVVLLDYAQVLLREAGIAAVVFDDSMSVMDGSLGILPRRIMVSDDDAEQARAILSDGIGSDQLEPDTSR